MLPPQFLQSGGTISFYHVKQRLNFGIVPTITPLSCLGKSVVYDENIGVRLDTFVHHVLQLEVSMNDAFLVHVPRCRQELADWQECGIASTGEWSAQSQRAFGGTGL